jgi:hypothetical protein
MRSTVLIEVLGILRQGAFTPAFPASGTRLESHGFVIGSRPRRAPAIVLQDSTVSKEHALVCIDAGGWRIRDLDSDNGLYLFQEPDAFSRPEAAAAFRGEHVRDLALDRSRTLALGAVVVRLTVENADDRGNDLSPVAAP